MRASFLLERSCGHDRDKLFQQRAYRVFSIENTIRQRLVAGDRNDSDVRTDEIHLRQDGTAITGSYQRKESLQIITDVDGFRRDMPRDAVLHFRWTGLYANEEKYIVFFESVSNGWHIFLDKG